MRRLLFEVDPRLKDIHSPAHYVVLHVASLHPVAEATSYLSARTLADALNQTVADWVIQEAAHNASQALPQPPQGV